MKMSNKNEKSRMQAPRIVSVTGRQAAKVSILSIMMFLLAGTPYAEMQAQSERLSRVTNQSSQRYEINQTFGGLIRTALWRGFAVS